MADQQELLRRVQVATERWMVTLAVAGREIPLDLVRAYLIFRFGLRRS